MLNRLKKTRRRGTTGSAPPCSWLSAPFWQGQCKLALAPLLPVPPTRSCRYTVWFDKIDRLPYLLYTMKQNARKQQIESILKYAMEKGLTIPAEIAKTPELHRITYVGSKILADQLVFSSLCVHPARCCASPSHAPQLHRVLLLRRRPPQRIHPGRVQRGGQA